MKTVLIILLFLYKIKAHLLIYLSDEVWILENANKSISVEGSVPGGVYSDLRKAGILSEDILYRFNDEAYRWVGYDNWTYTTEFFFNDNENSTDQEINIVFNGIDTIAKIYLNKNQIGTADNMFVRYRFNIKPGILKNGENNELQVRIESPITWAKKKSFEYSHKIPVECWPSSYHGECHINLIRKMQASFAWDWGPAFPSMGIWKDVYVEKCWSPKLTDIGTIISDKHDAFNINIIAWFDPCCGKKIIKGTLTSILHLEKKIIKSKANVELNNSNTDDLYLQVAMNITIDKNDVELWWPNGYGKQPLYNLEVAFSTDNDLQIKFTNIAFRNVELIQEPLPSNKTQKGLGFHFRVNGVDIYAKGSNWIPSDILPENSGNKSRIRYLLESGVKAHFNMLRVWGGGLYESNFFYEECDRLGIMIWQDLMFACNMYPADDKFLNNVKIEISQQIKRLQHHPSIVVWAGNNENEAALAQNWYGTEPNFALFKSEYIKLYVDTIKPIVETLDPTRKYLESSPSNGIESVKEGYISKNPQSTLYGDVHFYNYLLNVWDPSLYPRSRFSSEYGIQSLPNYQTMEEVTIPSDLKINSKWIESRQHQPQGFFYLLTQIPINLPVPKTLKQYIYYSQINQAMGIQIETETYRRMRSTVYSTGEGKNMGALYWQLNDVWQAPSWSSIDYSGRWKMLHYYAIKMFAPIIITAWKTPFDWVVGYIVSDKLKTISDAKLTVSVLTTQSFIPLKSTTAILDVKPNSAVEILSQDLDSIKENCDSTNSCFIHLSLKNVYGEELAPDNYLFIEKIKDMKIPNAKIEVTKCSEHPVNHVEITLRSNAVALFVWLDTDISIGHFSDNGFHMIKSTKKLTFTPIETYNFNVNKFCKSLKIIHFKTTLN